MSVKRKMRDGKDSNLRSVMAGTIRSTLPERFTHTSIRMRSRTAVTVLGVLTLTVGAIAFFLSQYVPGGAFGVPGGIRTRLYANLARSAGVLGFREVESWAAARADCAWRSGLEEHVVRGDVVRLFLRGAEGSIKEDDFLPLFRADNPTHPSIFAVARLAAYEYAAAASEAPSHVAYLRKGYQDQFESFCRKIGVRVVPEPAPKSAQPYLREHVMKGGTYVEAPLDTILFDLTDQCAPGIGLVFIVHEVALASTPITIELPADVNLEETVTRLCRAAKCGFKVHATWAQRDGLDFTLERPGARKRVGLVEGDDWPDREVVVVDPHHICRPGCPCTRRGSAHEVGVLQRQESNRDRLLTVEPDGAANGTLPFVH